MRSLSLSKSITKKETEKETYSLSEFTEEKPSLDETKEEIKDENLR